MMNFDDITNTRVSRFDKLQVMEAQQNHDLPIEVADIIWSRKLLPVIGHTEDLDTPFGKISPIKGAADMTMTMAVCPPGTGPSSHNHASTYETFTVLQSRFEFGIGPNTDSTLVLDAFDTLSVPPGVFRSFKNVGDVEGIVQVIITGGIHDMNDISFPRSTAEQLRVKGSSYLEYFKNLGFEFNDSE